MNFNRLKKVTILDDLETNSTLLNSVCLFQKMNKIDSKEYFENDVLYSNFIVDFDFFFESKYKNSYYYKRLKVTSDNQYEITGELFSLNTNLDLVIEKISSNKIINTRKDDVEVCKDCENRYRCFDARKINAFVRYESECSYNPYISKWEGEKGYRTLAECGVISDENGFTIDHEKIAEINKYLWGEEEIIDN